MEYIDHQLSPTDSSPLSLIDHMIGRYDSATYQECVRRRHPVGSGLDGQGTGSGAMTTTTTGTGGRVGTGFDSSW